MLTTQQFERTQRLALNLAGIELLERHREVLGRRCRRLGFNNVSEFDSLLGAVEEGESTAAQKLLSLVTVKFTGFFRHRRHFEIAMEHVLRAAVGGNVGRIWSAGTATGEEAYSLSITAVEIFRTHEPPVEILATDVDAATLAIARRGEYGEMSLRTLDAASRGRYFTAAGTPRRLGVVPAIRRMVDFRTVNLADQTWPVAGPFDVIFCRNVLMYFDSVHRCAVLERMASLLAPDGLLMTDPAEHLGKAERLFTPHSEGVYSLRRANGPPAVWPGGNDNSGNS